MELHGCSHGQPIILGAAGRSGGGDSDDPGGAKGSVAKNSDETGWYPQIH